MLRLSRQTGLGAEAPDFALPDGEGRVWTLADFAGSRALLVAFICNHCPFVLHILDGLLAFARDYAAPGPRDRRDLLERSRRVSRRTIPRTWRASPARTRLSLPLPLRRGPARRRSPMTRSARPDFFLFDRDRTAVLRRPVRREPAQDQPPARARPAAAAHRPAGDRRGPARAPPTPCSPATPPPQPQRPSAGCSIKWLPGQGARAGPDRGVDGKIIERVWVPGAAVRAQERGPDYLAPVDDADWSDGNGFHRGFFSNFRLRAGQGGRGSTSRSRPPCARAAAAVRSQRSRCCGKTRRRLHRLAGRSSMAGWTASS